MQEREDEEYDGIGNHPGPFVTKRTSMVKRPDWLAVIVAGISIATQIGAWMWWGGRLSQRVDAIESAQVRQMDQYAEFAHDNTRQDISISVTSQQYTEVIRRLDRIDAKLERR